MKKFLTILIIGILIGSSMIWLIPYVRNEILTLRFGDEFTGFLSSDVQYDIQYFKVLDYSEDSARIYCVTYSSTGEVLHLSKIGKTWELQKNGWETIWSDTGSADGFIWPYISHSTDGLLIFILFWVSVVTIVSILTGLRLHISGKEHKKVQ